MRSMLGNAQPLVIVPFVYAQQCKQRSHGMIKLWGQSFLLQHQGPYHGSLDFCGFVR